MPKFYCSPFFLSLFFQLFVGYCCLDSEFFSFHFFALFVDPCPLCISLGQGLPEKGFSQFCLIRMLSVLFTKSYILLSMVLINWIRCCSMQSKRRFSAVPREFAQDCWKDGTSLPGHTSLILICIPFHVCFLSR